jgi:hypothetical protein
MPNAQYGSLPFSEAITFFNNKLNLPSERWADVWRDQHNLAFMVAGATKTDLLADMRQIVDSAIVDGKSLNWFKSNFKHLVKKHGWDHTGSAAWRANIIYSTNVRQSYNAGRYQQLQNFEFWRYKHGDSHSPRPEHQKQDGKILPKTSPFWQVWFPQNGWGCKCKVFGESAQSMQRKGLKQSKEPVIKTREWVDKVTGETHNVPIGIDPGFDYSPGKTDQAAKVKQQVAAKPPLAERLAPRRVPSVFSTVKGVTGQGIDGVLQRLSTTAAAPQIEKLANFLDKYQTKTVVVNKAQMGRGKSSVTIAPDVAEYLGVDHLLRARSMFTSPSRHKPEGFTSRNWEHVVVKAASTHNLKNIDVAQLISGVKKIMHDGANNTGPWDWKPGYKRWHAFAQATDNTMSDNNSRFLTWLHEIGHQVHYKSGLAQRPTQEFLTAYGNTNQLEWFAEHFGVYILARDELVKVWPETTKWFDTIMEQVLNDTI